MEREVLSRAQVVPLWDSGEIYQVLTRLVVGDAVPAQVLILDYRDGTVPFWVVREVERTGRLCLLTVCDERPEEGQLCLPGLRVPVARDVIALPTRTLAGPLYGYVPDCEHPRNPLKDIRQAARALAEKLTGQNFRRK